MLFHHDSSAAPQTVQTALPVCGTDGKLSSVELGIIPFLRTHLVFPLPALGMFGDPLGGLLFGGETLDYFRLAIGPKNIDHPAKSGITF